MSAQEPRTTSGKPRRVVRRLPARTRWQRGNAASAAQPSPQPQAPARIVADLPPISPLHAGMRRKPPDFDRIQSDAQRTMGKLAATAVPNFARVHRVIPQVDQPTSAADRGVWEGDRKLTFSKRLGGSLCAMLVVPAVLLPFVWGFGPEAGAPTVERMQTGASTIDDGPPPPAADPVRADRARGPTVTAPIEEAARAPAHPRSGPAPSPSQSSPPAAQTGVAGDTAAGDRHQKPPPAVPPTAAVAEPAGSPDPSLPAPARDSAAVEPAPVEAQQREELFFAQLASFGQEADARSAGRSLQQQHADVLKARPLLVVAAEIGDKTVHRLRTGPFREPAEAEAVCEQVRWAQGDCFVVGSQPG